MGTGSVGNSKSSLTVVSEPVNDKVDKVGEEGKMGDERSLEGGKT